MTTRSKEIKAFSRASAYNLQHVENLLRKIIHYIKNYIKYSFKLIMGGGVMSLRPSSARTLRKDAGT